MSKTILLSKVTAEFLGTFFLLNAIVGSGIMAAGLTKDVALQLAINALSTVLMLAVLIAIFQNISGAHFNPIVTLYEFIKKRIELRQLMYFLMAQLIGAISGSMSANLMFNSSLLEVSTNARINTGTFIGEVLATFGLIMVISMQPSRTSILVPAWIGTAYFFTSSTSFANPAVTVGRVFTDSFAGIGFSSVTPFIAAQFLGLFLYLVFKSKLFERIS